MEHRVKLPSSVTSKNVNSYYNNLTEIIKKSSSQEKIKIDFNEVSFIDSAGVIAVNDVRERAEKKNILIEISNVKPTIQKTLELFGKTDVSQLTKPKVTTYFEQAGNTFYNMILFVRDFILLLADSSYWCVVGIFKPRLRRKGETIKQSIAIGVNALPIVGLIAFLIGFILALQSANQLRQFGANIYVADLVAVAMVGEMGPLMTAILIAGRSGSAIAAEIATMKVTEEIDALKAMGIDFIPYLVVPKLTSIIITLPMLTILANFIGILGGAIIGLTYLDIGLIPFFNEVISVLRYKEVSTSLIKSVVFAVIIVLTAVHFGIKTKGGPESVGRSTTASVVASIFLVIFADAMLSLLFYFD